MSPRPWRLHNLSPTANCLLGTQLNSERIAENHAVVAGIGARWPPPNRQSAEHEPTPRLLGLFSPLGPQVRPSNFLTRTRALRVNELSRDVECGSSECLPGAGLTFSSSCEVLEAWYAGVILSHCPRHRLPQRRQHDTPRRTNQLPCTILDMLGTASQPTSCSASSTCLVTQAHLFCGRGCMPRLLARGKGR